MVTNNTLYFTVNSKIFACNFKEITFFIREFAAGQPTFDSNRKILGHFFDCFSNRCRVERR